MAEQKTAAQMLEQMLATTSYSGYTQKTEAQLREQAATDYASYYNALNLAANQAYQRNDLALQQQAAGLQSTYDRQRQDSAENYRQMYSQTDRQILARGMQRSSYALQTLANVSQRGEKAQQALWEQQAAAEANIGAQRSQLAQQLSEQLLQYAANQQLDVMKRYNELSDREYDRSLAASQYSNQLSMQMYQMLYQAEQDRIAQEQWQKQFDEGVRQFEAKNTKSSGSSSNSSNQQQDPAVDPTPVDPYATKDPLMDKLTNSSAVFISNGSKNVDALANIAPSVSRIADLSVRAGIWNTLSETQKKANVTTPPVLNTTAWPVPSMNQIISGTMQKNNRISIAIP